MTTDAKDLSLAPASVNIVELVLGDTPTFKVTLQDKGTGLPIDITGTTGAMTVKTQAGVEVFALTTGSGITVTNGAGGEFTVAITAAQTLLMNPQFVYKYDFQWTSGATVLTILKGTVRPSAQQTA